MTDTAATENKAPAFNLQRIYLKGTSLEIPGAPAIFADSAQLAVHFNLDTRLAQLSPNIFEVALHATATAKKDDKVYFLLEVEQAGIFELVNIPSDQLSGALEVNAPHILTPYLRSNVADLLQRASLPTFLVPEINWGHAFIEKQKAMAAQQAGAPRTLQ